MVWTKLHWTNNTVFCTSTRFHVQRGGLEWGGLVTILKSHENIKFVNKWNYITWWEAIEWKDIIGHILTTKLRYSDWLTFFSAEIPGRGDLGLGEIKGLSSSTSFRNSALLVLKFVFQSSSKHRSSFILRHQRSVVRPLVLRTHGCQNSDLAVSGFRTTGPLFSDSWV